MNFSNPEEYYDFLDNASVEELHQLVLKHESCFSDSICDLEKNWFEKGALEDLFVLQIAAAENVSVQILEYLLGMSSGSDGGRYAQVRWAILDSPALTTDLLRKIDPYGIEMGLAITRHKLVDSSIIREIYNNWYDQDSIIDYMKSENFSNVDIEDYLNEITGKLAKS